MIKIEIMKRLELGCENLAGNVKMPQIGTGKIAATVTIATLIHRARIPGKFVSLDAHLPAGSKKCSGPGVAGGKHAVEQVITAARGKDQIFRPAHAHEITGPLLRQESGGEFTDPVESFLPLADSQSSLNDAEQGPVASLMRS